MHGWNVWRQMYRPTSLWSVWWCWALDLVWSSLMGWLSRSWIPRFGIDDDDDLGWKLRFGGCLALKTVHSPEPKALRVLGGSSASETVTMTSNGGQWIDVLYISHQKIMFWNLLILFFFPGGGGPFDDVDLTTADIEILAQQVFDAMKSKGELVPLKTDSPISRSGKCKPKQTPASVSRSSTSHSKRHHLLKRQSTGRIPIEKYSTQISAKVLELIKSNQMLVSAWIWERSLFFFLGRSWSLMMISLIPLSSFLLRYLD